jgi:hypothetical protein
MTGRYLLCLTFVLTLSASRMGQAADEPSKPTCEASLVSKAQSKPPANNFYLKLTLRNPTDNPRWFVIPYFGNDRLKSDTIRFLARPVGDPPFESSRYRGRGGDAVIVGCHGSKAASESFNAILLPPRSEVVFEEYVVMTFGEILEGLEVREVASILVDGETPLEKWLPYPSASGDHAVIPKGGDREVLDFDRKTYKKRTGYPRDPAKSVSFKDVTKTFLKVKPTVGR